MNKAAKILGGTPKPIFLAIISITKLPNNATKPPPKIPLGLANVFAPTSLIVSIKGW